MKRIVHGVMAVLCFILSAQAQAEVLGTGFNAPTIAGKANVYSPLTGELIYDSSDTTFYGYNGSSWQSLGGTSVIQSSGGGNERVSRFRVASCTSGTCTITSQSGTTGNHVSDVSYNSGGGTPYYDVTFVSGVFSASPTCVCNAEIVGGQWCTVEPQSATALKVSLRGHDGSVVTPAFSVICMGAR
jgi:hypothetical protein